MKKHLYTILLLAPCFLPGVLQAQPTRHALLIAIGNYAPNSGWPNLASARDADLMHNTLLLQGFSKENIHILLDSAATLNGIEQALHKLVTEAQSGDAVLIHFSGHGQQVSDNNNDESDGYDEAMVPYDSPMHFQTGKYEGERLLRDDVLGQYVKSLRNRLGVAGSILVLLDGCHSGTGLRGDAGAAVRGTDQPMASQKYKDTHRKLPTDLNAVMEGENPENTAIGAPVVAFFAASAHEANYESRDEKGQRIGSLTYAFCKAFAKAKPSTTYRVLFDQIKTEIYSHATLQNPQAEGALDRRVLDGQITGYPAHFEVKAIADARTVLVSAGQLSGLTEASELAFYPIGTYDTIRARPLALGVVESVEPLESVVGLSQAVEPKTLNGAWVFLRSQAWQPGTLRVQVDLPDGARADSVLAALKRWRRVILVEKEGDFLINNCARKPNSICLNARGQSAERMLSGASSQPNQVGATVVQALSDLAMANFLRGLSLEDDALRVRLAVVPQRTSADTISATLTFRAYKDTVALRVTNTGSVGCYYTLIDIQPDGRINVALPEIGRTIADYFLKPGAARQFDISWFSPPTGTEVFKLIASREPLDLRPVVQTRGRSTRGKPSLNVLETLLAQRYDTSNSTLNRGPAQIAPGGVSVTTLVIQVE
ncbi:MAG: caspase family protein [Saprospiraceae bacterium]|nr:caspase family protein [Saprospiraceae bacterium]